MRDARTDPELQQLIRRFVAPDRRYLRLGGSCLRMSGAERELFMRGLVESAREITPAELGILLEGGWRERKTACWLIAVARRTEFRGRLGELLMGSPGPYGGSAGLALATFATEADADLLCAYLDRCLSQPDVPYDQGFAVSTLLHLDAVLGTERAAPYLADGGLWRQWIAFAPNRARDPREYQQVVARLCSFAGECAELLAAGDQMWADHECPEPHGARTPP
ncbi:DUF6000 family protein [Streptomyces sp. NPDC003327]